MRGGGMWRVVAARACSGAGGTSWIKYRPVGGASGGRPGRARGHTRDGRDQHSQAPDTAWHRQRSPRRPIGPLGATHPTSARRHAPGVPWGGLLTIPRPVRPRCGHAARAFSRSDTARIVCMVHHRHDEASSTPSCPRKGTTKRQHSRYVWRNIMGQLWKLRGGAGGTARHPCVPTL